MISSEVQNTSRVFLYKEDSNYYSYERSAWFLCTSICKQLEVVAVPSPHNEPGTILSVRIPLEEVDSILANYPRIINTQNRIVIQAPASFDIYSFYRWKSRILDQSNKTKRLKLQKRQSGIDEILSLIDSFDTITSTHLDCMNFIERLKNIKAGL